MSDEQKHSASDSNGATPTLGARLARVAQRVRSDRRLAGGLAAGAVALVALVVIAFVALGGDEETPEGTGALSISPAGEEAPRLGPVVISFTETPPTREPERLVSIEPAVEGEYAWLDDRRLLFQPDFPGFLRGAQYAVTVHGDEAGTGDDTTQAFTVEGRLEVRSVIPGPADQAVPPEARIFVQFSRSVAPLTLLSAQPTDEVIEFEPALSGRGEWLNTSLYAFTPDDLRPSTTYRGRIAAGLSSAADGVLEEDYEWEFSTYQPALASSTPADGTSFVAPNAPVVLTFNQPMDRASVEAGVVIREDDGDTVAFGASWSEDSTIATLTTSQPLGIGQRYQVSVPEGLVGAAGGETQAERVVSFTVANEPRLLSSTPADGSTSAQRFGMSLTFNNPMDLDSLEGALSISGFEPEDWRLDSWNEREVYVNVQFEPSSTYTVAIEGARDRAGLALPRSEITFTTGALQPGVGYALPNQFATFAESGEQTLYFYATNQDSVAFELFEVSGQQFRAFQNTPIPEPGIPGWKPAGQPLRAWSVPVEGSLNTTTLGSTSIGGEGGPLGPGTYYLRTPGSQNWNAGVFFAVVDTEIVTKLSWDELLVWALDHETGQPVANLELTVSGGGIADTVVRTDAEGIATVAVPRPSEMPRNESRSYYVNTTAGGRFAASSTAWQQGAEPWLLGVAQSHWDQERVAHVYTDRPIYRSGETVFFKTVVRLDDDASYSLPPAGATGLTLQVTDAQGQRVVNQPIEITDFGTFAGEFDLPDDAPTGFYNVAVVDRSMGWEQWIANSAFQVAEFRTPEFRVEMTPVQPEVVNGETIEVDLEASFFFGGPLEGATVTWSAMAFQGGVRFEEFPGYSFSDFDFYGTSIFEEPLRGSGEGVTDASGRLRISLPAELRAGESTTTFDVSATVLDQSGQAIGSTASVRVHPASVYAGITTSDYVARQGQETDVLLATVDTEGNPLASRPVTVQVYEREWITVKEATESGGRRYRSEPRDTLLQTLQATTDSDGVASVAVTPSSAGSLRLVASTTDAAGRVSRSATYLWVAGEGYAPWRVRNDSVIELVADQDSYRVGDTAQVLVPAPFEGARALVSIERGNILQRETRVFETNSEMLSIPITDAFVPNVYVSVVLYRPPTEDDPVPRYHLGYVELPVSTEGRELNVTLEPSVQRAEPGQRVRYDITVTDFTGSPVEAELSVVMVDAAVLSLSDLVDQDGLQAFWFQRGLAVQTASSLSVSVDRANDTVPEPEAGGKGGGEDGEALRSNFQNTAFWDAFVRTDAQGRASVEVDLPDNLTTWRTQARAVGGDTLVGEATHELVATKPLLVRPALPRFARVGDALMLRTLVRNATTAKQEVTVGITVEGLDLEDGDSQTVLVQPGQSAEFEWPARATTTGTAAVSFRALAGEMQDAAQLSFPVHLDVTPETMATGGVVVDESMLEALYLPQYAITDNGALKVRLQASIVGALQAELGAFVPHPYEGPAEVASRVIATLAARGAEGQEGADLLAGVDSDMRKLMAWQRTDGGWGWCNNCTSDPVITAWVLMAFGDAVESGWEAPNPSYRRGAVVLDSMLRGRFDVERPPNPNEKAFFYYAIQHSRDSQDYLNAMRSVYEQDRELLTPWGRAYLVLGLLAAGEEPDDSVVRGLMSDLNASVIPSANGNHWEGEPVYGSVETNVSMTALVLRAFAAADPEHPLIEETARWLVSARDAQRWQSRIERAQAISGLGTYAALTGERAGEYDFRVQLDGSDVLSGHLDAGGQDTAEETLPLSPVTKGEVHRLSFEREKTNGRMYYVLNLRYVTPASEVEALSRGISVAHEYTLLSDPERPVAEARLGDIVRVKVTVMADADRKFVQVQDFLPAGLEGIDAQLATVPDDLRRQLEEERQEALGGDASEGAFAPWYRWYWSPWQETNVRDDRFTMFATDLPRGVHEYVYYARATTPGDFFVAPAHAEEGAFPEVFGRSDSGRFRVVK